MTVKRILEDSDSAYGYILIQGQTIWIFIEHIGDFKYGLKSFIVTVVLTGQTRRFRWDINLLEEVFRPILW